jgi:hypothetical protein
LSTGVARGTARRRRPSPRPRLLAWVVAGFYGLLAPGGVGGGPGPPRFAEVSGVRDPAFETLLAFNLGNGAGHLTGHEFARRVEAADRPTALPVRELVWQRREPTPDSTAFRVETVFLRPIDVPVPYEVLGYHPGSFRASGRLVFREVPVGESRLYLLEEGRLEIDIDGWLDALAGSHLDDTDIRALALHRANGRWYGLALGVNPKGEPRSGTLDFADDRILYPTPEEFRATARAYRKLIPPAAANR